MAARYKDNKEGRMNTVVYIYTKFESEEISGHIDLSARFVRVLTPHYDRKLILRYLIEFNLRISCPT